MSTSKLALLTISLAARVVRGGHFGFQLDYFRFRLELQPVWVREFNSN